MPSEMPGVGQWRCLAVISVGNGKPVVEQVDAWVVPLVEVPGRPLSMARRYPCPEGANVSDRYPKGRDRLRAPVGDGARPQVQRPPTPIGLA